MVADEKWSNCLSGSLLSKIALMNLSRRKQTSSKRISNSAKRTNVSELSSGGTRDRIHHRARTSQTKRSRRPRPMRTRTTNSHVLTVGHRVESPDTTLSGEPHLTQIEKSTLPVTAVRSVAKGSTSRRASAPTRRGTPGSTATRSYTVQPPSLRVLLLWPRLSLHTPRLPRRGAVRVNVIAQAALSRYDHRLPYRKIADRFEQLHGLELSGASAWHRDRARCARRSL